MLNRTSLCGLAVMVLLVSACSTLSRGRGESGRTQVEYRVIRAKREPNLLISTDGSECTVSRSRWDKAKVGEQHLCAWEQRW